uniref:Uncharacterized protein n=1 Tax=Panagrolaimus sp. JU765 TaxID=591449 RepID=A0AC34RK62_9BILA
MEEEEESQSFANCQKQIIQKPTIYEKIWLEGNKIATFMFIAFSVIAAVASVLKELTSTPPEPPLSDDPIPTLSVGNEFGTLTLNELHQTLFSLVILLILAIAAGYVVELLKLPALL